MVKDNRYSVIDMGSNSIRLLNAEVVDKKIKRSSKKLIMTRLGKNVDKTKMLSSKSVADSVFAVESFLQDIEKSNSKLVDIIATSAVRDAKNSFELLRKIKKKFNIDVNVISGEHEAYLGYLGVLAGIEKLTKNIIIIDIGGGSTEIIIGNNSEILYSKSVNMGAVRFTEKFINSDIPTLKEVEKLVLEVKSELNFLDWDIDNIDMCVGIGGTATTIAAIDLEMDEYNRDMIHGYDLKIESINNINKYLSNISLEERKKIRGLEPKRADIIFAGSVILEVILNELKFDKITISDYDNLEGILKYNGVID